MWRSSADLEHQRISCVTTARNLSEPKWLNSPKSGRWKRFSLVYESEELIPVEIREHSLRFIHATGESNNEALNNDLNLVEGRKELVLIQIVAKKQRIKQYYNKKANLRQFEVGDYVLWSVFSASQERNVGKLGPNWEGPYQITKITWKGSYKLEKIYRNPVKANWNVAQLKRFYFWRTCGTISFPPCKFLIILIRTNIFRWQEIS